MKKLRVLSIMVILLLTACSGEDFYELEAPAESPWPTVQAFERSIIGAYGVLFYSEPFRHSWPYYAVLHTSMGDDVEIFSDPQWGYFRATDQGPTFPEPTDMFYIIYRGLGTINDALDFVEENDGNPYPSLSESQKVNSLDRMVGELHFLRGFCYYMLQTTFGAAYVPGGTNNDAKVPLVTSFATNLSEAQNPKIGTTQEVWDFIRDEFLLAKELLPEEFNPSLHEPGYEIRSNRFAASAFLMRTYFQRGEYDLAEDEAGYIINSGRFNLSEDPIEAYNKSGFAAKGAETIYYLTYLNDITGRNNSSGHLGVINHSWIDNVNVNFADARMADYVIEKLGWKTNARSTSEVYSNVALRDKRFTQLMQERSPAPGVPQDPDTRRIPNDTLREQSTLFSWKYFRGPDPLATNIPLVRLAEIYLTRSIIRFNANNPQGAADDLNMVRRRAWDSDVAGDYTDVISNEISAEMIHDERLLELFCEGDRINYWRSLKGEVPQGARGFGSDAYTSDIFVWSVPLYETLFNNGLD